MGEIAAGQMLTRHTRLASTANFIEVGGATAATAIGNTFGDLDNPGMHGLWCRGEHNALASWRSSLAAALAVDGQTIKFAVGSDSAIVSSSGGYCSAALVLAPPVTIAAVHTTGKSGGILFQQINPT